jgi:hypothetical protein
MKKQALSQAYTHMGPPWFRIPVHKNKIECLWQFGNHRVLRIFPEIARSEVRYRITEFTQKFVCILLAVCTSNKTSDPWSARKPVMIIANLVKALWNFDGGLRKV